MLCSYMNSVFIAGLGAFSFLLSLAVFFRYFPDISLQVAGGVSLFFPAMAYGYVHEKYPDVFIKSFLVGTALFFFMALVLLRLYLGVF